MARVGGVIAMNAMSSEMVGGAGMRVGECRRGGARRPRWLVLVRGALAAGAVVLVAGLAALVSGLGMGQALAAPVGAANKAGVSRAAGASDRLGAGGAFTCRDQNDGTPPPWGARSPRPPG